VSESELECSCGTDIGANGRFNTESEECLMTMDELRRQLATTQWPIVFRVDGKNIEVSSRDELMVPPAGNLICVYQNGAFEVIDSVHIATLHRIKTAQRQTT